MEKEPAKLNKTKKIQYLRNLIKNVNEFTVFLIKNEKIKCKFRKVNKPTDVLSSTNKGNLEHSY